MESESRFVERANRGLHASLLNRMLSLPRTTSVLDVGCGTGAWLNRLAESGFTNLSGIDREITNIPSRFRVTRVDLNAGSWSPLVGTFDVITVIEVIEHIENLGSLMSGIRRHLAPGGCVILTTPNIGSIAARLRFLLREELKYFDRLSDPTHLTPVLLFTLPRLLERHGLRIDEEWGFPANGQSLSSRWWVSLVSGAMRIVLPERVAGDNLCLRISASD